MVIVPVVVQVGCVTEAAGAAGAVVVLIRIELIQAVFAAPFGSPGVSLPETGTILQLAASVVVHVGCCVTEAAGAAGADETAFTVTLVGAEIQPALFLTVTL